MNEVIGTKVVNLGFTREELEDMDRLAFPAPIEEWLHELVARAIEDEVTFPFLPARDAMDSAHSEPES